MGRSHGFHWTPERRAEVSTLRASGLMYYEIAKQLSVKWGVSLTESQCSSAAIRKAAPQPAVEFAAMLPVDGEADERMDRLLAEQPPETKRPIQPYCTPEPQSTIAGNAPVVQTSKSRAEAYLVVPDLQAPFQALGALEFCERVRREFGIPKENVLFTGDEADNFNGKSFDKKADPDAEHTPKQELRAAVDELKRWYAMYPNARLAVSNHGTRYERRAAEAEISSQWMRLYRDVIEAPPGWVWKDRWVIKASKHPFVLEHGHEGASRTEAKVLENGYSTVHGHYTKAQIVYVSNHLGRRLWGFCAAALIDYETYAFKYAKKYPRRADNGVGVILDGGRIPLWVPLYEATA